ncbi:MAG: sigma 54-interacting transcriptional regulator [Candidatus Rokubacteria bacterium]|nr:sigma 54-interacting transcriptional regulator [Candidatus Rokubacteria bacterium]
MGAGQELVAGAIQRISLRHGRRFEVVNCAALPRGLLLSELFGHGRGAFTGAVGRKPGLVTLADHGTVFLDEIGELSVDAQMVALVANLTPVQREALRLAASRGGVWRRALIARCGISREAAWRVLVGLVRVGALWRKGSGRGARYLRLSPGSSMTNRERYCGTRGGGAGLRASPSGAGRCFTPGPPRPGASPAARAQAGGRPGRRQLARSSGCGCYDTLGLERRCGGHSAARRLAPGGTGKPCTSAVGSEISRSSENSTSVSFTGST